MAGPPRHNTKLRFLIAQAGLTGEELARTVNALGRECGIDLHYRRASVGQWQAGTRPRPPVPELIAEALTRRLGRPVTPTDAGFDQDGPPAEPPGSTGIDVRRLHETAAVYRLAEPREAAESVSGATLLTPAAGRSRVGTVHAHYVDDMTSLFSLSDGLAGSGAVLPALTTFCTVSALPWLNEAGSASARRALQLACSRLTYLGGALQADQGRHGTAQYWYRLAADLAAEGGSPHTLAVVTRALSLQAHHLGHRDAALQLAERAGSLAVSAAPRTRAFLEGQLALTLAGAGRRHEAVRAVRRAERWLERADPRIPAVGAYHPAALAYQRAEVRRLLGDGQGAVGDLRLSVEVRPATEPRAQALVLARLGELTLAGGDLEGACASWESFLTARAGLLSRRVDEAHRLMRDLLAPHRRNPAAARLLLPRQKQGGRN
ncbi:hypothetical protein [Kitasatospora purpeofusca]|uniref:hypothetical protein n=1 Tax=Kitasatospora purpeofusca TaxID=67352 RepID=UPI00386D686F